MDSIDHFPRKRQYKSVKSPECVSSPDASLIQYATDVLACRELYAFLANPVIERDKLVGGSIVNVDEDVVHGDGVARPDFGEPTRVSLGWRVVMTATKSPRKR